VRCVGSSPGVSARSDQVSAPRLPRPTFVSLLFVRALATSGGQPPVAPVFNAHPGDSDHRDGVQAYDNNGLMNAHFVPWFLFVLFGYRSFVPKTSPVPSVRAGGAARPAHRPHCWGRLQVAGLERRSSLQTVDPRATGQLPDTLQRLAKAPPASPGFFCFLMHPISGACATTTNKTSPG
jgi:hypothetical protein